MSKSSNVQAFPTFQHHEGYNQMMPTGGMTLRDYFAAKAMQGIVANSKWNATKQVENCVRESYAIADAMLAEREKP